MQAHGSAVARLVGRRLLVDVLLPDFSAVASNGLREPDPEARSRAEM